MRSIKAVVLEAILLALAGVLCAMTANALSPRGLRIARNYFPGAPAAPVPAANVAAAPDSIAARLQQHGLKLALSNEVAQLFRDPAYEQGLIVFVDARNDHAYESGHVPSAWQLDRYRPENYLPTVLPICMGAQKVVVYCNGGSCEDSEFAAMMLRDAGIAADNIVVYGGGISEWTNAMPFEVGARGS
ncbi:MAG TPA: rhodanese-like domain-containing protein, partial [Candidatus Binatia bacterium]|nr:rhodanese-like domain-containing protein [Candidatus Binatia bacterium]